MKARNCEHTELFAQCNQQSIGSRVPLCYHVGENGKHNKYCLMELPQLQGRMLPMARNSTPTHQQDDPGRNTCRSRILKLQSYAKYGIQ
jgi:hypothetical protein